MVAFDMEEIRRAARTKMKQPPRQSPKPNARNWDIEGDVRDYKKGVLRNKNPKNVKLK